MQSTSRLRLMLPNCIAKFKTDCNKGGKATDADEWQRQGRAKGYNYIQAILFFMKLKRRIILVEKQINFKI